MQIRYNDNVVTGWLHAKMHKFNFQFLCKRYYISSMWIMNAENADIAQLWISDNVKLCEFYIAVEHRSRKTVSKCKEPCDH